MKDIQRSTHTVLSLGLYLIAYLFIQAGSPIALPHSQQESIRSAITPTLKVTQPGDCGEISLEADTDYSASHSIRATVTLTLFNGIIGASPFVGQPSYVIFADQGDTTPTDATISGELPIPPASSISSTTLDLVVPNAFTLYQINASINNVPAGPFGLVNCHLPSAPLKVVSTFAFSGPQ